MHRTCSQTLSIEVDENSNFVLFHLNVLLALKILNFGTRSGPYSLSNKLFKASGITLAEQLLGLFRVCVERGVLLKKIDLAPVQENSLDIMDPNNWRPISQFNVVSKVFEKDFPARLTKVISANEDLFRNQYAFRSSPSPERLLRIVLDISEETSRWDPSSCERSEICSS